MHKKVIMNPFVKWAGGKRQLLSQITSSLPITFNRLYEPFVGGGALFMHLRNSNCVIGDMSKELYLAYKEIQNSPDILMTKLDDHEVNHVLNPSDYYYKVRNLDHEPGLDALTNVDVVARFIYLNKSCFNGLYRVNSKGFFNVPFGKKEIVKTYDKDNLTELSKYFKKSVDIRLGDFEETCNDISSGDFVFFDPPYDLLNETTFEKYNANSFGKEGQIRLANFAKDLDKKGVYFMVTNHNTPLIIELYKDFNIEVVQVKRMINSDSSNRVGEEVIITNYEVSR
jgi:DNA adenine methylase